MQKANAAYLVTIVRATGVRTQGRRVPELADFFIHVTHRGNLEGLRLPLKRLVTTSTKVSLCRVELMTTLTGRGTVHIGDKESVCAVLLRGIQRIVQGSNWPRRNRNLQRKICKHLHFTIGNHIALSVKTHKRFNKIIKGKFF